MLRRIAAATAAVIMSIGGGIGIDLARSSAAGAASSPGYWLVARDGGIFSYGRGAFHGSTGSMRLNQPIVSMTGRTDGNGYWFVAADGGVFAFDAPFFGSTGGVRADPPVVGGAAPPTAGGASVGGPGRGPLP